MISHSQDIGAIALALSKAQGEFAPILKDKIAKVESSKASYSYAYADLDAVLDATRPALSRAELAVIQGPEVEIIEAEVPGSGDPPRTVIFGRVTVETRLVHSSGQWLACAVRAEARDSTPQAIGGTITFLRRYGLLALLGVAAEVDTDAQEQTPAGRPKPAQRRAAPAASTAPTTGAPPTTDPASTASSEAGPASEPKHAWTETERKAYWARLNELGYYDDHEHLVAYCAAKKRPHPGDMRPEQRKALLDHIGGAGAEDFVAFCDKRRAA